MSAINACHYIIYVTLFTLLCHARHIDQLRHVQRDGDINCLYGNHTYKAGSRFHPDACTFCHCPRSGGRPNCAIEDCIYEGDCVKYEKTAQSQCCDICVEHGCRDTDGNMHSPGQVVSVTSCTTCHCPPGGGKIECGHVTCPAVKCVDHMMMPGACCPICPNGANCWLGGKILPADEVLTRNRCKTCRCPTDRSPAWLSRKGTRAVCTIQC